VTPRDDILRLNDAGHSPAAIATRLATSLSTVYTTLRRHRPDRPRAPRTVPPTATGVLVAGLLSLGHPPSRVAELARCSRAWVYKVQQRGSE